MLSFQLSPTFSFHVSGLAPLAVRTGIEPAFSLAIGCAYQYAT